MVARALSLELASPPSKKLSQGVVFLLYMISLYTIQLPKTCENPPAKYMKIPKHPTLIRRFLQARQKQLQAKSPVLAASLVTIRRACGNPNCRCARGKKHLGHYLTWKVKAKTHTAYVPVDLVPQAKQWTQEHRRLKQLVRELTQLSLALIQTHVTAQRRKRGRS